MRRVHVPLLMGLLCLFLASGCGSAAVAAILMLRPESEEEPVKPDETNTPPSIFILPISGTQSGDVTLTYILIDQEGDTSSITVEFWDDNETTYKQATESTSGFSEGLAGLASSPAGITHVFIWDSDAVDNLDGVVSDTIKVRIIPHDAQGTGSPEEITIELDNNEAPDVILSTPASPANGPVTVSYVLTDAEADTCSIMLEYSLDGGTTYNSATEGSGGDGTVGLDSSVVGTSHTVVWDSFADLGYARYIDVKVKITPGDTKSGTAGETAVFEIDNNEAPIAQVNTPTTEQSGNVFLTYKLMDSNSDLVDIDIEWWDPFDAVPQWKIAIEVTGDPSEGITGLTSSPAGTSHIFVWDSAGDLGSKYSGQIKMRIRPRDALDQGSWAESDAFAVSNNDAPITFLQTPSGVQVSNVLVRYYLADNESDTCSIDVYYSDDSGASWLPATMGTGGDGTSSLSSNQTGIEHFYDWDAPTDLAGRCEIDIRVKIVPTDAYRAGTAGATTDFAVDATTPPQVMNIIVPAGIASGNVSIGYTLIDAESQTCSIEVKYTDDAGSTWYDATKGSGGDPVTGLTSSPSGLAHTFLWDTVTDGVGNPADTIQIKITPSDTKTGSQATSGSFTVDNTGAAQIPWIEITSPSTAQAGTFDITYDLYDNQGQNCDIVIEYSIDGGTTWATCTGSPLIGEAPGVGKTFAWDSLADIGQVYDTDVKIRMRPTDTDTNMGEWAPTGSFTVDNNAAPWVVVVTPAGQQSGDVAVEYTLYDSEDDTCSISVEFSQDGGSTYNPATMGSGGDGTTPLISSAGGTSHTYVWDSITDIGATWQSDIRIRITPNDGYRDGAASATGDFEVYNLGDITWTGAVDDNWDNENNWDGGIPSSGSNVTIPSGCPNYPLLTHAATVRMLTLDASASFTIRGDITFTVSIDAQIDGTLTLDSDSAYTHFSVGGNMGFSGAGFINAFGQGYASGSGPSPGESGGRGGGGGHGGYGGWGENYADGGAPYDSVTQPSLPGSGGGHGDFGSKPGGNGGGAVKISVAGTFSVPAGVRINASGANGMDKSGGGAGGSIWIDCNIMTGAGNFTADGGDSVGGMDGGGGAGGRIAVYYNDVSGYTGTTFSSALGGNGWATAYWMYGSLIFVDKSGTDGDTTDDDLYIYDKVHLNEISYSFRNVTVSNNAEVLFNSRVIDSATCPQITLEATNDMTIEAGCLLTGGERGHAGSEGPGAGGDDQQSGGEGGHGAGHCGYGGRGDNNEDRQRGLPYGDFLQPTTAGSGGGDGDNWWGGGYGSGAIKLVVGATLTLDGEVVANGEDGYNSDAGGGSGGSIWIECDVLQGSGFCTAAGGAGNDDGGGGTGGRITIYYEDDSGYTGHDSCNAAGGAKGVNANETPYANGYCGSCIFVDSKSTPATSDDDIHIYSDCRITQTNLDCLNLELHNSATFWIDSHCASDVQITLTISGDCIVTAGCAIRADGLGYIHSQGPGDGQNADGGAGGAGYGGAGGDGDNGSSGGTYGDANSPIDCGSGGGNRDSNRDDRWGGNGGGSVKLVVSGTLGIDGSVSADGHNAVHDECGGGAGGSVWIVCGILQGIGEIIADAGNGGQDAGGGGGGRIKITASDHGGWSGTVYAYKGLGPGKGDDGQNGTVNGP